MCQKLAGGGVGARQQALLLQYGSKRHQARHCGCQHLQPQPQPLRHCRPYKTPHWLLLFLCSLVSTLSGLSCGSKLLSFHVSFVVSSDSKSTGKKLSEQLRLAAAHEPQIQVRETGPLKHHPSSEVLLRRDAVCQLHQCQFK